MKILILLGHILLCFFLVKFTNICEQDFFDLNNQITYLGVLLGFALTLYTFGLSTLKDVYDSINKLNFKDIKKKIEVVDLIKAVFKEIQDDVTIIFWAIVSVFINNVAENTVNPFGWDVENLKIPDFISLVIFSLSTHAIYDIMKSLFNLSELIFERKK